MRASAARLLLRRAHFDAAPSLLPSCGPQQLTDAPRGPAVLLPRDDSSTLSYVKGSTDAPLIHLTLGKLLERQASNFGSSAAVVSTRESTRLTYTELRRLADDVAQGLIALGVQRRDRVGVWAPNSAEWAVLQFAVAKAGAILVKLNPSMKAAELSYAVNKVGCSTLILAPELKGTSLVGIVESLRDQAPTLCTKVVLGSEAPPGMVSWHQLLAAGESGRQRDELRRRQLDVVPCEAASIQLTSGTTGFPKAAALSHHNILNNALFVGHTLGYTEADRVCLPVPLFHCFGSVMGALACAVHGATAVYPSDCFDAGATLTAVQQECCTSLYGVPAMFIAQLEHPEFHRYDLSSLRTGIMAGAPCPVALMQKVQSQMHLSDITICYGMTETSPVSFQTSTDDPVERRVSTVGRIHPHLEAKVVDPGTNRTLLRGQVGELCVRGYSVMLGYHGDPAATASSIDSEGWMHSGDLAVLDDRGYCSIVGRIKDMVIRGGENLFPREIEEFLHHHPAIADVQVFGVPDARLGEALCAWVRPREGHRHLSGEELQTWCMGRLSHQKIPRYWKLVDSYPTTTSGKPQKYKMREAAVQELGLQAEAMNLVQTA
ncbi:hypothetical protein D9Q98_009300 [Chlorella vulgaris]|uniref:Uncharacterized protein n=1 Tax=Chlorella vulgaris TaxID=3077 RepID=A0A9D4TPA0_CHLVU|nr:hypothetical protein D9Q98_009300 [Chlorella vulgaris]